VLRTKEREIIFEGISEENYEKYGQFIEDQLEKHNDRIKDATDYLNKKVKGKTYDIHVEIYLDETPSDFEDYKQFALNIGFEGEWKFQFTLDEMERDERICSLVLSDYDCFTIDDEIKRFQDYEKREEELEKKKSKDC